MTTTILKATTNDIDKLAPLFDAYRVWYRKPADMDGAKRFLQERLEKDESTIFIAVNDNKACLGFVQLYPSFSSTRLSKMWILNDLFVKQEERGKGHSKALISRAKKLCKETQAVGLLLETETNNHIGNRLYPSVGFELEKNNFYFWTNQPNSTSYYG